jgi:hypothetical protein
MTIFRKSPTLVLSGILVTAVAVTVSISPAFGEGGARRKRRTFLLIPTRDDHGCRWDGAS